MPFGEGELTVVPFARFTARPADPDNAAANSANSTDLETRLNELLKEIQVALVPAQGEPFIVFHDSLRHFDDRSDLLAIGSIVVDSSQPAGVKRIRELQD